MTLEKIMARQAEAMERIANALEKIAGNPAPSDSAYQVGRSVQDHYQLADTDALLRIRANFADQASSWDDFLDQLGDKRQPSITSDVVARVCEMGKSRIYKALQHTDLIDWVSGE